MSAEDEALFQQLADVTGIPEADRVSMPPPSNEVEREQLVRTMLTGARAQRKLDAIERQRRNRW